MDDASSITAIWLNSAFAISPAMAPSFNTTMRSLIPRSSSISEEIIRIDDEIQEVYGDAAESGLGETEPEQEKAENKEKGEATDGGEPGKDDSEEETEVKQETEVTKEPGNTQESKEAAKETAETENLKTAEEQEEE